MSSSTAIGDVRDLRDEYESNTEWNLRRQFLEANLDSLPLDRLVCLSRCFVNIAVYQCSYPPPVMQEVSKRGSGILKEIEKPWFHVNKNNINSDAEKTNDGSNTKYSNNIVKNLIFPKESESEDQCHFSTNSETKTADEDNSLSEQNKRKKESYSKADSQKSETEEGHSSLKSCNEVSCPQWDNSDVKKLYKFKIAVEKLNENKHLPTKASVLHRASTEASLKLVFDYVEGANSENYDCNIMLDDICLATGKGRSKKKAKIMATEVAIALVLLPNLQIFKRSNMLKVLTGSSEPVTSKLQECIESLRTTKSYKKEKCKTRVQKVDGRLFLHYGPAEEDAKVETAGQKRKHIDLENFVIMETEIAPMLENNPVLTLQRSAHENQVSICLETIPEDSNIRCILTLNNESLANVVEKTVIGARRMAAAQALKTLKSKCWTVFTKPVISFLNKEQLNEVNASKRVSEAMEEINPDSDVGDKMLLEEDMGEESDRIAKPGAIKKVFNRQDLGLSENRDETDLDDFQQRIETLISNFISGDEEELVCTPYLSKREKRVLSQECEKYAQITHKGSGKGRYMYNVICRKRSPSQWVEYLRSMGGESGRNKLLPPNSQRKQFDLDKFILFEIGIPQGKYNSILTLRKSAYQNQVSLCLETIPEDPGVRCILTLDNETFANVVEETVLDARRVAAAQALKTLKSKCWTVLTKPIPSWLNKEQLNEVNISKTESEAMEEIKPDSDVGDKMLVEGDLDKESDRIAEPGIIKKVFNRQDLGLSENREETDLDDLQKRIEKLTTNFLSGNEEELVFTYNLNNKERFVLFKECEKCGLITYKSNWCNVFIRNWSPSQWVDYLRSMGGESERRKLLPPNSEPVINSVSNESLEPS